jgi:hypothetical protein
MVERWGDRYSGSEMKPRCDPARAVHLQNSPRWRPAKASSDGTNQGLGTPSFPYQPFHDEKVIGHAPGAGTGEPQQRLRVEETIHQFRSPFWKGHGAVL